MNDRESRTRAGMTLDSTKDGAVSLACVAPGQWRVPAFTSLFAGAVGLGLTANLHTAGRSLVELIVAGLAAACAAVAAIALAAGVGWWIINDRFIFDAQRHELRWRRLGLRGRIPWSSIASLTVRYDRHQPEGWHRRAPSVAFYALQVDLRNGGPLVLARRADTAALLSIARRLAETTGLPLKA